jgi:hypothetical protein
MQGMGMEMEKIAARRLEVGWENEAGDEMSCSSMYGTF